MAISYKNVQIWIFKVGSILLKNSGDLVAFRNGVQRLRDDLEMSKAAS